DHETQVQWLYDWWERIDEWVTENWPGNIPASVAAPLPGDETAGPAGELPRRLGVTGSGGPSRPATPGHPRRAPARRAPRVPAPPSAREPGSGEKSGRRAGQKCPLSIKK